MVGPDHLASLTPEELKQMVASIRNIELAISGNGIKEPSLSEQKNLLIARKSIHTNKMIKKGQTIKKEDLIMMRPGDGISPMLIESVIDSLANKNLPQGYKISQTDLTKKK
jgi:N-acetylneuraminate synthase/N,N'-diacetyllegionaminate synthase